MQRSKEIAVHHRDHGNVPTLRQLPKRLSREFEGIEDSYIHQLLVYLDDAIEDLYIINLRLNSPELDKLLSKRFPI